MELTEEILAAARREIGRRGGLKGGPARAKALSGKKRSDIARLGANARWVKQKRKRA